MGPRHLELDLEARRVVFELEVSVFVWVERDCGSTSKPKAERRKSLSTKQANAKDALAHAVVLP